MPRCSTRTKKLTPATVTDSDDDFVAVASESDEPVDGKDAESDVVQETNEDEDDQVQGRGHGKNSTKVPTKNKAIEVHDSGSEDVQDITPPPTPSPVKAAGKKRAMAASVSDDEDSFVPSPTRDSPRKARAVQPSTPSKGKKAGRQLIFDTAVSSLKATSKAEKSKETTSTKSPSKAAPVIILKDDTVYQTNLELHRLIIPALNKCQIKDPELTDELLKATYKNLPMLPRMADFAPTWGTRCEEGGFMLSDALALYNSPDKNYVVQLIAFDYDKVGNLGNLSRINPALLGTKDVGKSIKNSIHLFGQSAEPLLCFSVVMVMGDNHEDGLEFGSETGWIVKSVPGMLPSLELERLVSVLGLAFQLPYMPDDSSRCDTDILYVSMYKNAFNFSMVTTPAADVKKAAAKASSSKTVTGSKMATGSKLVAKKGLFAPASPAMSKKIAASTAARKYSLRATEAVPIYDGRKRQLKVPDDLRRVPAVLPRYMSTIPDYSLVLVAYTASTYLPITGARKNQVTANLNIHFAVVLYEPVTADNPVDMDKPRAASSGKSKRAAPSSKGKGNAKADESSGAESDDAVSE